MTTPGQGPLRWGVVGTGAISRQIVADFALLPSAKVTAVASRQVERAEAFADEFGIAQRFSSRSEMFGSDIDAVYIATPHVTHFELASEAVAFAKHLAADMRCLETAVRPTLAIEVVAETAERIHREPVFA